MEINYQSGAPAALWKPAVHRVYLIYGEEDRLKEEALIALIDRLVQEEWRDFDLEILHASSTTSEQILSASGQMPFGAEVRLVAVRGVECWRERARQGEADRLAEAISRISASSCLVLIASAEEDEGKRKTAVTAKLDAAVKKIGALVACHTMKGEALIRWISLQASQGGKTVQRDAAELLVDAVGSEMLLLSQEINKLISYAGERSAITRSDVERIVATSPEDVMFAAVDAITRRQTDRALTLLAELHRHDPKPQAVSGKLLALLARQYRMLWQARFLAEKRVSPRDVRALPPDLAAELPGENSIVQAAFRVGDLFAMSRNWSWDELSLALEQLLMCDLANKGGVTEESDNYGGDPVRNLQLLTLQLTAERL